MIPVSLRQNYAVTSFRHDDHAIIWLCFIWNISHDSPVVFSADETEMRVTWVTQTPTDNSMVGYGQTDVAEFSTKATMKNFTDPGLAKRTIFVYRATMVNLKPGQRYGMNVQLLAFLRILFTNNYGVLLMKTLFSNHCLQTAFVSVMVSDWLAI